MTKLYITFNRLIWLLVLRLVLESTCDKTYESGGYLMSPNYPQRYENNLDCRWTIKAPVENNIALTISEFQTSIYGGDNLHIYQGTNIHGNLLKFCFCHNLSKDSQLSRRSDVYYRKLRRTPR